MMMFVDEWVVWGGVEVQPAGSTLGRCDRRYDRGKGRYDIIFLNKEIGACEKNLFVHIQIILLLKDLILVNTN
jgi:hypothetical protein